MSVRRSSSSSSVKKACDTTVPAPKPSWRHATSASGASKPLAQTWLQEPSKKTCRRPVIQLSIPPWSMNRRSPSSTNDGCQQVALLSVMLLLIRMRFGFAVCLLPFTLLYRTLSRVSLESSHSQCLYVNQAAEIMENGYIEGVPVLTCKRLHMLCIA